MKDRATNLLTIRNGVCTIAMIGLGGQCAHEMHVPPFRRQEHVHEEAPQRGTDFAGNAIIAKTTSNTTTPSVTVGG